MAKSNMEESLEKLFNMEESEPIVNEIMDRHTTILVPKPDEDKTSDPEVDRDFRYVRLNMINLIEEGQNVMETLADLAKTSQSARTYEVLAQIMRTLMESNRELIDLQKKRIELAPKEEQHNGGGDTHNHLYVGSTKDLAEFIKNRDKITAETEDAGT